MLFGFCHLTCDCFVLQGQGGQWQRNSVQYTKEALVSGRCLVYTTENQISVGRWTSWNKSIIPNARSARLESWCPYLISVVKGQLSTIKPGFALIPIVVSTSRLGMAMCILTNPLSVEQPVMPTPVKISGSSPWSSRLWVVNVPPQLAKVKGIALDLLFP